MFETRAVAFADVNASTEVGVDDVMADTEYDDLDACHIAFQRRPGNRHPDIDPSAASINAATRTLTWGPPIR